MGRFARSSERGMASNNQVKATPPRSSAAQSPFASRQPRSSTDADRPNYRAPSEMKYFVLALAALIGLGIGWLAGKAITQSWNSTPTPALAEPAVSATFDGSGQRLRAMPTDESDEPTEAQADLPEAADANEPNAPLAVVTQAATNDSSARAARRVSRRAAVRRHQRGNIFFRPFKALRKFRVW